MRLIEHVGERGAQRVRNRLGRGGHAQANVVELGTPYCGGVVLLPGEPRINVPGRQQRSARERRDDADLAARIRRQVEAVREHRRRESGVVGDRVPGRHAGLIEKLRATAGVEIREDNPFRRRQGEQPALAVDRERIAVPAQLTNRRHAPSSVQELGRRIDLERPHRKHQRHDARLV